MKALIANPKHKAQRVFLVGVELKAGTQWETSDSMAELAELARTAGSKIVGEGIQKLESISPATFIGTGKAAEFAATCRESNVDTVIFDDELSPSAPAPAKASSRSNSPSSSISSRASPATGRTSRVSAAAWARWAARANPSSLSRLLAFRPTPITSTI